MEKDGVISKVTSPTKWVNSLVIVAKPEGALRACLDLRDLNKSLKCEKFQLPTGEEISSVVSGARHFTKLDANHAWLLDDSIRFWKQHDDYFQYDTCTIWIQKNAIWNPVSTRSQEKIKKMLLEHECLAFYNARKPVTLQVDACKTGLGAVLIQEDRPVSYASRAMTDARKRFAMIEKELLNVVFGCEGFYQYIYGKEILVKNDHKPLEDIFQKPCQARPRLQRMLLRLQRFVYKPDKQMFLADTVTKAHWSETAEEIEEEEMVAHTHMIYQRRSVSD